MVKFISIEFTNDTKYFVIFYHQKIAAALDASCNQACLNEMKI